MFGSEIDKDSKTWIYVGIGIVFLMVIIGIIVYFMFKKTFG